ncbi:hypothetical protein C5167_029170 [Papaver somniferum]|uniref:protein C2-DOMAIN ABA-RELATED 11-like n=1 Tax=Papaver somniferum TaxID=3469 RepID=UPI000E704556|nr:protein C2-DOMAIN ABA-RELATED 11-like [Papaver somniferum]RZC93194.1 hypothetical protein C5167_029170 [Papaver somniferum]
MGEKVGVLKVTVVQGKQLMIRDFRTSDPYVVFKLGNQVVKTKVINSCLNPVWNEELSLDVTQSAGVLNKEVFDKDRFKSDDKMGTAHLNLQQIASAARLKQVIKARPGESTKIRIILPGSDNSLVRESYVSCVNGEILQDVWLRLCGVESGELEMKLKWIEDQLLTTPVPS